MLKIESKLKTPVAKSERLLTCHGKLPKPASSPPTILLCAPRFPSPNETPHPATPDSFWGYPLENRGAFSRRQHDMGIYTDFLLRLYLYQLASIPNTERGKDLVKRHNVY
jgi:hypothetical protein